MRTVVDVPVAWIAPETEAVGESGTVVAAASGTDTATATAGADQAAAFTSERRLIGEKAEVVLFS